MQVINIFDAKTQLFDLVDQTANGKPFIIAKNGKPLVKSLGGKCAREQ